MTHKNIFEEEIKNTIAVDYFGKYDCTKILGKIDFAVKVKHSKHSIDFNDEYLLWAEAKQKPADIIAMLAQLVLTIGKARTFDEIMPPPFLGCYDSEKIAFIPYSEIQDIFYQNDFNWNVTSSNHDTKEFKQVYSQIKKIIDSDIPWETYLFYFKKDEEELRRFIRQNFIVGKRETSKIKIDKNNFIIIYGKWLDTVKPTIQVNNWTAAKKAGIIDGDFYLADLLSDENKTLKEKLFVLLKTDHYELDRKIDESGFENFKITAFSDNRKAHTQFWAKYERPPHEDYWDYIIERRDLLVPQDVRERKGSFFTPKIWVELSQKYIADVLGENWQDEYYVWDCCAGTGNLLAGLTNKYNLWASTLDKADVDAMHDRIKNGANLLHDHVFQFDFLNDDFSKLPHGLQDIINNPKLRKQLIIYINPPYAEASKMRTLQSGNEGSKGVEQNAVNKKYANLLGQGNAELFAQFFTRIYCEIPGVVLAEFSKLKILQGQHFVNFRKFFLAKLLKMFVMPANTFDNVTGQFPVGFIIWDTDKKEPFKQIITDIYDKDGNFAGTKKIYAFTDSQYINDWIKPYRAKKNDRTVIGKFPFKGNDFQNQNLITIVNPETAYNVEAGQFLINIDNLIIASIYFAVRKVIPADWLNDRDQFLFPNKKWEKDLEFQNDCLIYTLFTNKISSKQGKNHWIPFKEDEVNAPTSYDSHIMITFLSGEKVLNAYSDLFSNLEETKKYSKFGWKKGEKREFSPEAQAVFDAGRELWRYYHSQKDCNVNASLYDIREYFQRRNDKGKMNTKSDDPKYTELINTLRNNLKILAKKIEPKVYEYGFLKT
ncbi:MAG: hypothetical protein LBP85_08130 [Prevotellaceae bacterium]|jgi:uncharacterized protein (DUF3820 family)|nr:hypothetical protein [Prevotellaceae bacterium]